MAIQGLYKTKSIWRWEKWSPVNPRSGARAVTDEWTVGNLTTDEGIEHALDVVFSGGAQKSAWYIAIFEDDHTPVAGDTYQTPGYTECTAYDEGARPTWQEGGVASKSITNSANAASFTFNATKSIYGASLVSANTKGDSVSGEVLYLSTKFTSAKSMEDDEALRVTATINGQDA